VGFAAAYRKYSDDMGSQVLLVESDSQSSAAMAQVLGEAGHCVTAIGSFEEAVNLAARARPDLVIAGVRLGRFNGLHLAARFRADYPSMPIIILGHEGDSALAAEAIQLRARFVPKTTPAGRLMTFVEDLLSGRAPRDLVSTRRWTRRPTSLPVRGSHMSGWVLDVGYGGLRVECPTSVDIDTPAELNLPTLGINVKGLFRWAKRSADDTWSCGFELDSLANDTRKWRRIVDSVSAAH
jgi:DNA-binding response OmpR family regulator